ncbi:MAG: DUF2249 domain-containing protein [Rubrivivax sp.]|nr:DUF2249 domain-containing protein [Rubrivivax sp.]
MIDLGAPAARTWTAADGLHVDVRGLQAPQPLVLILQLVQQVGPRGVLIVHHDRDPLLLYPELVQIGWWAERIAGDPDEVRLRLAAAS